MTTALLESPLHLFGAGRSAGPRRRRPATLEERLEGVLRAAQADGRAQCPVCGGGMQLDAGTARCGGCGSALA